MAKINILKFLIDSRTFRKVVNRLDNIHLRRKEVSIYKILKYLDQTKEDLKTPGLRKRDIALKRSIGFIRENENKLLSVKELCEVSQVSERTLEYAFLEKYQVSPSFYIKAHHLNLVKKELVKLKGRKIRVSDVAVKYGFHHMGQFSVDFKKQFGLSPSKIR